MRKKKGKYDGEHTEGAFSSWCKSKGVFRLKLQVDRSNKSPEGQVIAKSMPSDFLVITNVQAKFVEVKEVWVGKSFPKRRLRQQYKLTKIARTLPNSSIMDGFVLINFVEKETVIFIQIDKYNEIDKNTDKKSLAIEDFPEMYRFTWKTLLF